MFESLLDNQKNPHEFLAWWNNNPIVVGGDQYSARPGMLVSYIPHSDQRTFEIRLESVQQDRPAFIKNFLSGLSGGDKAPSGLDIVVSHEKTVIATVALTVDPLCRWACGDGEWLLLQGHPHCWTLEYRVK